MYKKGGKRPKNSFIKESSEIKFGDKPSKKGHGGMMKYEKGGLYSAAEQAENIAKVKKMNSQQSPEHQTQVKKATGGSRSERVQNRSNKVRSKSEESKEKANELMSQGPLPTESVTGRSRAEQRDYDYERLTKKSGKQEARANKLQERAEFLKAYGKKTGGKKSMEPGGGGRFAALVSKLKGKGKSEGSAKAIAAAIGRNKYGKSKFQEMAAKGKKGLGGSSDSTSSNEAGMGMMEEMKKKRSERVGARSEKVMEKAKASWQKAEAIKKFDKSEEYQNMTGVPLGRTAVDKANRLYARAERQENRAKRLKEKSEFLKASGKRTGGKR